MDAAKPRPWVFEGEKNLFTDKKKYGIIKKMKNKMSQTRLPSYFKPLLWSYRFSSINPDKNRRTIIVNALNYGDLKHWRWLVDYYGKDKLREMVSDIPASEFRSPVQKLASLLLGVKRFKYASRSDKIKAEKNL